MPEKPPSIIRLLSPYWGWIALLSLFTLCANGLNLVVPELTAHAIDAYTGGTLVIPTLIFEFFLVSAGIFLFTFLQSAAQTLASERVARDLRARIAAKISVQRYASIDALTPAKLLTNLTSDVDAVKTFVSQAIAALISSVFLIIGASILLLRIDWKLALAVIAVLPAIAITFSIVLGRVRKLFKQGQEVIDWLNSVISESILGSALIRILNAQTLEQTKFEKAAGASREIGLTITRYFSLLIPIITLIANIATLIIVALGGWFVISGSMTLGDFTAFNNYLLILIFPIIVIGFVSNVIAQATASYARIAAVLHAEDPKEAGSIVADLTGKIEARNITLKQGERLTLDDVSFSIQPGTKNAIIGPTAAGKTQLLYVLTGLLDATGGSVRYDDQPLEAYTKQSLHAQVGFVFQDSIIFNLTLRENIAFNTSVKEEDLARAIDAAELHDFIGVLPEGLDTVVSERGTSLSGGQKQRIMLARALALNPRILLLDDFTARVDTNTERKILDNVARQYPNLTLISVAQKIAPIEHYDQIILLMEGEVLAVGKHEELLHGSPEYAQIYDSQKSTESYG